MAKKILLVEDDDDIAALLRLNLQDEGYQIVHEADGAQALVQLEKGGWDAAILDLMLPNVDGLEICRRIRQMTRYLPVIISAPAPARRTACWDWRWGRTTTWPNRFRLLNWSRESKRCFVARRRWGLIC